MPEAGLQNGEILHEQRSAGTKATASRRGEMLVPCATGRLEGTGERIFHGRGVSAGRHSRMLAGCGWCSRDWVARPTSSPHE
jgi:hypothetical protein